MKKKYLILLFLIPLACQLREKKSNISNTYDDIRNEYRNIRFDGDEGPLSTRALKDSGNVVNGVKEGLWSEYSSDTSHYDSTGNKVYEKEEIGKYLKGKRNGAWITYVSFQHGQNFGKWGLFRECNYSNGIKDSLEVLFYSSTGDTDVTKYYKMGKLQGKYKRYFYNYKVESIYTATNGELVLERNYYANGLLRCLCSDSVLNNVKHRFLRKYEDSCTLQQLSRHGNLIETAFSLNDTVFDGPRTKYYSDGLVKSVRKYEMGKTISETSYHKNGQLWTTWEFKDNLFWNVLNDFDSNGSRTDHGTFKNGNGTLRLYREDGSLIKVVMYKNGKKVNSSMF